MFSIINWMTNIPEHSPKPKEDYKCQCRDKADMAHIFYCDLVSNGF